jgi:hypothetical protein
MNHEPSKNKYKGFGEKEEEKRAEEKEAEVEHNNF